MAAKIYPHSRVELNDFIAKNYDAVMNVCSFGMYSLFMKRAVSDMRIHPDDHILDLGCGTGKNAKLMAGYLNEQGSITGLDISAHMERQFLQTFKADKRIEFISQRIDKPFNLQKTYDTVFTSFVIHGFPHQVRYTVIQNAYDHLQQGGSFFILDYAEFDIDQIPLFPRYIFHQIECPYAFDFIQRDWNTILRNQGFGNVKEYFYVRRYIRLLHAKKIR